MTVADARRVFTGRLADAAPWRRPPAVATLPPATVREARRTTKRVDRTFAIACRFLPRACRQDVSLAFLVFRTRDDLVDDHRPEAAARVAAVEAWAEGRAGAHTPEVDVLER